MITNPYEELGVSRNAGDEEIKKAYRDKAKQYHPDHNPGDKVAEEKFRDLGTALAILKDPHKRAKFDQTGKIEEDVPPNPVENTARQLLTQILMAVLEDESGKLVASNLVDVLRMELNANLANAQKALATTEAKAKKAKKMAARFKRKSPGKSAIIAILEWKATELLESSRGIKEAIAAFKMAIEITNDHTFEPEIPVPQPAQQYFYVNVGSAGGSSGPTGTMTFEDIVRHAREAAERNGKPGGPLDDEVIS